MPEKRFPMIMAVLFTLFFIVLGIHPVSRAVWIAEVIPVVAVFIALVVTYRKFQFSNTAYSLMACWLFWHTIGGHYTFANVPFGFISDLLGSERNHFDRVGHFMVGFYAFPLMEWLTRRKLAGIVQASFFGLFFIMAVAAAYEIIEWQYAVIEGGDAGIGFLGSQGDIWDAQKDMLADTLGAITTIILFWIVRPDRSE